MSKIQTESEIDSHEAEDFFSPGWAGAALYLLLSCIILVALNAGSIINSLSNNYIGNPVNLKSNFNTLLSGFNDSFSSALGGRLGQILLWSCVGALVYISIWLLKNILNSFENDIIADHYLHPSNYNRAGYWGSTFSVKIFLSAMVLLTVGYFFMVVTAVLPAVSALAGSAAYNFHATTSPFYLIFAVFGVALVLYLGVILLRLIAHLWRLL